MPKSVKVHDETHRALKELKARRRSKSIDQVVREMIAATTGTRVDAMGKGTAALKLTSYIDE